MKYDWIILGGGWAGLLSLASILRNGQTAICLEKGLAGGLARTFRTGSYFWDLGPHALYSTYPGYRDFLSALPIDYVNQERNVKVCYQEGNGRYLDVEYPFEFGLSALSNTLRAQIISEYRELSYSKDSIPDNLFDWMNQRLGKTLSELFMKPYNEKIWPISSKCISSSLVHTKIHPPTSIQLEAICGGERIVGRAYQQQFLYPVHGVGELCNYFKDLAGDCLHENESVYGMTRCRSGWRVATNSNCYVGRQILSTIPMPLLLGMLGQSQRNFIGNTTCFIQVALKPGCRFSKYDECHWTFHPNNEVFYRLSYMHNFSPNMQRSLVAEITIHDKRRINSGGNLESAVINDLIRIGVLDSIDDVSSVVSKILYNTYPIPTLDLSFEKEKIQQGLREKDIHLLGRSGSWDYCNMDKIWNSVYSKFPSKS